MSGYATGRDGGSAVPTPTPLPPRYSEVLDTRFLAAARPLLRSGCAILDVGAGRQPTLAAHLRPAGTTYVGLDPSAAELSAAAHGSYDETVVAGLDEHRPELVGRFDLAISWQVLEHVPDVPAAISNLESYLRPGGTAILMFSGSNAAFAAVNRALPHSIGKPLVTRIMRRSAATGPVFPAYYDHCSARALRRLFKGWSRLDIHPYYVGAAYFRFFRPLFKAYLRYEEMIYRRNVTNLATHYLVVATV